MLGTLETPRYPELPQLSSWGDFPKTVYLQNFWLESAQIFASGQRRALNFAVNGFERLSKNGFTKIPSFLRNLIHFLCLIGQRDGKFVCFLRGMTFQASKTLIMSGIEREDIDLSHRRIRQSDNST